MELAREQVPRGTLIKECYNGVIRTRLLFDEVKKIEPGDGSGRACRDMSGLRSTFQRAALNTTIFCVRLSSSHKTECFKTNYLRAP